MDIILGFLERMLPQGAAPLGLGGTFFAALAWCGWLFDQPPRKEARGLAMVGLWATAVLLVWWLVVEVAILQGMSFAQSNEQVRPPVWLFWMSLAGMGLAVGLLSWLARRPRVESLG